MNLTDTYRNMAKKYPPLTDEEEVRLAKDGSIEAREKLFNHNIAYALKVSYVWTRMKANWELTDDIIQAAMAGMWFATETYDGSIRFASYASSPIRWNVYKDVLDRSFHSLKMPARIATVRPVVLGVYWDMVTEGKEWPQVDEVYDRLEGRIDKSLVKAVIFSLVNKSVSMDTKELLNGDVAGMHDILPSEAESPDTAADMDSVSEMIRIGMEPLTCREKEVISRVFGLFGMKAELVKEIADDEGLSPQRISQLLEKGMAKLSGDTTKRYMLNYRPAQYSRFRKEARKWLKD